MKISIKFAEKFLDMRHLISVAILLFPVLSAAQNGNEFYYPKIDGTVKARMELSTEDGNYRFNVRNARFGVSGNITDNVAYRLQVDFSNQGAVHFLDAYASYRTDRFQLSFGQQPYNFSTDMVKAPSAMIFSNRSMLAKFITTHNGTIPAGGVETYYVRQLSARDLGALATYSFMKNSALKASVGLFSGSGMNNPAWDNSVNIVSRIDARPIAGLRLAASFYDGNLQPQDGHRDRLRMAGVEAEYISGDLKVTGEYARRYMKNQTNRYELMTAAFAQGIYYFRMSDSQVKYLAPAVRWDMAGDLPFINVISQTVDKTDANRITLGFALGLAEIPVKAELRLNYEKYIFRDKPTDLAVNRLFQDKVTLEFVASF